MGLDQHNASSLVHKRVGVFSGYVDPDFAFMKEWSICSKSGEKIEKTILSFPSEYLRIPYIFHDFSHQFAIVPPFFTASYFELPVSEVSHNAHAIHQGAHGTERYDHNAQGARSTTLPPNLKITSDPQPCKE